MKKETVHSECIKLKTSMTEDNLCDYYEPRRKGKYKTRCKNCVHFREKEDLLNVKRD